MIDTREEIGQKIKSARMKANISQGDLGKVLGKSHAAVSDIERGKTELSVSDLQKIASTLGLPLTHFIDAPTPSSSVNFRYDKDVTPEQVHHAKQVANDFRAFVIQKAKEENNGNS